MRRKRCVDNGRNEATLSQIKTLIEPSLQAALNQKCNFMSMFSVQDYIEAFSNYTGTFNHG